MVRSRWVAALAALSVALGGTTVLALGGDELEVATDFGEGDGLNRFVLTLSAAAVDQMGSAPSGSSADAPSGAAPRLDVEALAAAQELLGRDGELVRIGDASFYISTKGGVDVTQGASRERVSLDVLRERLGAPLPVDAALAAPASSEGGPSRAALEALEASPEVSTAQVLPDGKVLVAGTLDFFEAKSLPGVVSVEESVSVPVLGTLPTDPYFAQYGWNLENTGSNFYNQAGTADADADATTGWDSSQGQSMVVAVIDSGYDSDHPDLAGALWTNPNQPCGTTDNDGNGLAGDCHGWNFYTNSADIDNTTLGSHGASVSGVVAARANNGHGSAGLAPQVKVMPLVIGGGSTVDVNLGAKAIRYAVDHGADVINASWGGAFSGTALQNLRDAVAYAAANDVLVVAAAGNDAADRDTNILYPASLTDGNIFTIGSSTASDTMSTSSAYGAVNVDMFAPGNVVATTWNDGGYRLVSGTSIAAPHVAAAVALYKSVRPGVSALDVKAEIMADSQKLSAFSGKSVSGGRLTLEGLALTTSTEFSYTFSSMSGTAGPLTPQVVASGSSTAGRYSVVFTLAMEYEGEIWALAGEPVTMNGTTLSTDDTGAVVFDLGQRDSFATTVFSPAVDLGPGRYGLMAQVVKDGTPLSRPYAAPLLVSEPGTTDPGTTDPGTTDPGTTSPGTSPTDGGTTDPGTTSPGTSPTDGGTTDPGTSDPGTTSPGTSPTDGGTTDPGATDPGTTSPGTSPTDGGTTDPGTTSPGTSPTDGGTTDPGTTSPGTSPTDGGTTDPGTTDPGTTDPGTTSPGTSPTDGGSKEYPAVGDFKVTSISPVRVSTSGGTYVKITGEALPADPGVRVGDAGVGEVVSSSSTELTFRTPARIAGVYDVTVYDNGLSSTLTSALEYYDDLATTDPGTTDPGTTSPGTSPTDGGTTDPGTTSPGTTSPGTSPTDGGTTDPGTTGPGTSEPTVPAATSRTGPSGERLVRNEDLVSLSGLWSLDCSTSCQGMQV